MVPERILDVARLPVDEEVLKYCAANPLSSIDLATVPAGASEEEEKMEWKTDIPDQVPDDEQNENIILGQVARYFFQERQMTVTHADGRIIARASVARPASSAAAAAAATTTTTTTTSSSSSSSSSSSDVPPTTEFKYVFRSAVLENDVVLTEEKALLAAYAAKHNILSTTVKWTEQLYNELTEEQPCDLILEDLSLLITE